MFKEQLKKGLKEVIMKLGLSSNAFCAENIKFEHPSNLNNGDYSSNIALMQTKGLAFSEEDINTFPPIKLAQEIKKTWEEMGLPDFVEKIEVAGQGFINIWLKNSELCKEILEVINKGNSFGNLDILTQKKIIVEFAHPNTHKELHIGHMRTLITGEALSRILSFAGANVFRANYQGDIGPHVAKSIWGTVKVLEERGVKWEEVEKWTLTEKAHLLGEGYIYGVKEYENSKEEIDELNKKIYDSDPSIKDIYETTRRWSLDYYDMFYSRFLTKFDRLFFESEVADKGKKLVEENVVSLPAGRQVFEKSEGAIIFNGEKYGLHKRVFITSDGNPTYEGKEMALAYLQYKTFPFDKNIHVVASEQNDYFKVVIKALETLDSQFIDKESHLSMGMVQLVGKKMSSRTGVILKVDDLLDEVKQLLLPLVSKEKGEEENPTSLKLRGAREKIAEVLTIASVKYSILRVDPRQNVLFDPEKLVSLQGDSGPYIEYTYARTQSVLRKSQLSMTNVQCPINDKLNNEELQILRTFYKFPEVVEEAARLWSPNLICNFLFDLAQKFNLFYDKHRILVQSGNEKSQSEFRILLTAAVGQILKNGLNLLGIEALDRM